MCWIFVPSPPPLFPVFPAANKPSRKAISSPGRLAPAPHRIFRPKAPARPAPPGPPNGPLPPPAADGLRCGQLPWLRGPLPFRKINRILTWPSNRLPGSAMCFGSMILAGCCAGAGGGGGSSSVVAGPSLFWFVFLHMLMFFSTAIPPHICSLFPLPSSKSHLGSPHTPRKTAPFFAWPNNAPNGVTETLHSARRQASAVPTTPGAAAPPPFSQPVRFVDPPHPIPLRRHSSLAVSQPVASGRALNPPAFIGSRDSRSSHNGEERRGSATSLFGSLGS